MTVANMKTCSANVRRKSRLASRLLSSGCVVGIALSLASYHSRGDAQTAFQGTGVASGGIVISQGGVDGSGNPLDTIISNASTGVIDWTPSDTSGSGTIDFLPANRTVRFTDGIGNDFTILNRINPTDSGGTPLLNQVIQLNGRIESFVNGQRGGNVWFYTPGGFLVGGSAVFDVGGLVLSTIEIDDTQLFTGSNGTMSFGGPNTQPGSKIAIAPGASITADGGTGSSYVALVAPRIEQGGTVDVNGNIAYVAAEAADITINNGFFDIAISTGTTDTNGVVHNGTTTGPGSTTNPQHIFMVAVPKNQALTMLLSGSIGYDAATSAAADDNGVVLSAGKDIFFNQISSASAGTGLASISIGVTDILGTPGDASFTSNAIASATGAATLTASAGHSVTASQNLTLEAGDGSTGGTIKVLADGGTISVAQDFSLLAVGDGGFSSQSPTGDNATGGSIDITVSGNGSLVATQLIADASARGGAGLTSGGNGAGGTIDLIMADNGNADVDAISLHADGYGAETFDAPPGSGTGGSVQITGSGATTLTATTLDASANGMGGTSFSGSSSDGADGGNGTGGIMSFALSDSSAFTITDISLAADGIGGAGANGLEYSSPPALNLSGGAGGDGTGGNASVSLDGGALTTSTISVTASGAGGGGGATDSLGTGGAGGMGAGGSSAFSFGSEGHNIGAMTVASGGTGGAGGIAGIITGVGPDDQPILDAGGPGTGGAGGAGIGGAALMEILFDPTFASLSIDASGIGGAGASGAVGGVGGSGIGGSGTAGAQLLVNASVLTITGSTDIRSEGFGGDGGNGYAGPGGAGGNGTGGDAGLSALNGSTVTLNSVAVMTSGNGGDGGIGGINGGDGIDGANGGDGQGGNASVLVNVGSLLTIDGAARVASDSVGGNGGAGSLGFSFPGGTGGSGGSGTAGQASLAIDGGSLRFTSSSALELSANGFGGNGGAGGSAASGTAGGVGGTGSNGRGGVASFTATDGDYDVHALLIRANGTGGNGGAGGTGATDGAAGTGGGSTGGQASLTNNSTVAPAASALRHFGGLTMEASGFASINSPSAPIGGAVILSDQSAAGGPMDFTGGQMTLSSFGAQNSTNATGVFVTLNGGTVEGGDADMVSNTTVSISADGAGSLDLSGQLTAIGDASVQILHNNRSAGAPDTLSAGGNISLGSNGPITGDAPASLHADGDVLATSTLSSVSLGSVDATNIMLNGLTGVTAAQLAAGSDVVLRADNGAVTVTTDLAVGGSASTDGRSIAITTSGDIAFDHAVATAGDFTLTAGGAAAFSGASSAQNIAISSADIDIGADATLSAPGQITLATSGSGTVDYIGGGDVAGGYSLSGAEIARLFANDITIRSLNQSVIGDFAVLAGTGGNIGTNGLFLIDSAGRMRVEGGLQFSGLGQQGGLTLRAGNGIDVIADSAFIDLRGANGALGGVLSLQSPSVIVATQAAIDDISGNVSIGQRDRRLAQNDGIVSDEGFLRASTIQVDVTEGVYIQNSGAGVDFDQRRGFTADNMLVNASGGAGEIVINGRLTDPATGAFATGLVALQRVVVNDGAGGYAFGSTINGCLISSPTECRQSPTEIDIPTRNADIERELNPNPDPLAKFPPTLVIQLKEFEQMGFPPLIDEPVTGAGNDDLWTANGCTDSSGATCEGGTR